MRKFWITTIIILLLLAGCSQAETRIGWVGSSLDNQVQYHYEQFNGSEVRDLILTGDMTMNYDVVVDGGNLFLALTNPEGTTIWSKMFSTNDNGVVRINVDQNGRYRLTITGEKTNGRFDINWEK